MAGTPPWQMDAIAASYVAFLMGINQSPPSASENIQD